MKKQFKYWIADVNALLGKHKFRIVHIWMSRGFVGISLYRFERALYISLGKWWSIFRILLSPLLYILYSYSNMEINYKADIGPGIKVLHPSGGVVISGKAKIGKGLTLTGGNIIGAKPGCPDKGIQIGDNCSLGANAVIIGPLKLGNNINVGASACVVKDEVNDGKTLVGVPAKTID